MSKGNQVLFLLAQMIFFQTSMSLQYHSARYVMKSSTQFHSLNIRVGNKRNRTLPIGIKFYLSTQQSRKESYRKMNHTLGLGKQNYTNFSNITPESTKILDLRASINDKYHPTSISSSSIDIDRCKLQFDGGSRGNPGIAGYGFVLLRGMEKIGEGYGYLDRATNNEAEYMGLLSGLRYAQKLGIHNLDVEGDSLLVVKQMLGEYAVKALNLKPLHHEAQVLSKHFQKFSIQYIPRNDNALADQLANIAMDRRGSSGL